MKNFEKEFVPPTESLELKILGFDEPCFGRYYYKESYPMLNPNSGETELVFEFGQYIKQTEITILAPTYSQAFRFFREKYGLYHSIGLDDSLENNINCDYQIINHSQSISELETSFKSYEEAELACLRKLIEIVKQKQQ